MFCFEIAIRDEIPLNLKFCPGANITILARTESKLRSAQEEIRKAVASPTQVVHIESADVSDFAAVRRAVDSAEKAAGPIFGLIANAGSSQPGYFLDQVALAPHNNARLQDSSITIDYT